MKNERFSQNTLSLIGPSDREEVMFSEQKGHRGSDGVQVLLQWVRHGDGSLLTVIHERARQRLMREKLKLFCHTEC